MMNTRNFLIVIISITGSMATYAQANLLNAKIPDGIGFKSREQKKLDNDKPMEYGYVDDRDILMGKTVWEIIDLSERINFPLYFPIDTSSIGPDRRSLYDVLTKAIRKKEITEVYSDSYFNTKITYKDIQGSSTVIKLSKGEEVNIKFNSMNEETKKKYDHIIKGSPMTSEDRESLIKDGIGPEFIDEFSLTSKEISQYLIKGYWYFDKRQSELKYRLLGICPVGTDIQSMASDATSSSNNSVQIPELIPLFWVFFPAARDVLYEAKSFNDRNSAMPISFDQILNSRRFNSVIYQEENVYGDRTIVSYMKDNAQKQLLESERVKEKIRNFEENMWNY